VWWIGGLQVQAMLVLDRVVRPFMGKYFEMQIWHPTSEKILDELLNAQVDL
jgi:hypothetical protein